MNRHIGQDHKTAAKVAVTVVSALLVAAVLITLSGCSTVQKYTNEVIGTIEQANDRSLSASEKMYFDGVTMGALVRRYGDSPEIQKARNELGRLIRSRHYSIK